MDSINILALDLIIVIYTFLTNLFCCFIREIAKIKMSPESVTVHHERHSTQQYVQDIFVAAGFSAVHKTTKRLILVILHGEEKGHVYLSIVLLVLMLCYCYPVLFFRFM